jgi:hypothetical protein
MKMDSGIKINGFERTRKLFGLQFKLREILSIIIFEYLVEMHGLSLRRLKLNWVGELGLFFLLYHFLRTQTHSDQHKISSIVISHRKICLWAGKKEKIWADKTDRFAFFLLLALLLLFQTFLLLQ